MAAMMCPRSSVSRMVLVLPAFFLPRVRIMVARCLHLWAWRLRLRVMGGAL